MLTGDLRDVADRSKHLYEKEYRLSLEKSHWGADVCIEPDSEEYFLGATFDDAVNSAINAHPNRLTHTLRIGHSAALHLGLMIR